MKKEYLKDLNAVVRILLKDSSVKETVDNLKAQIQKSDEPFVWETIGITPFKDRFLPEIQSVWTFVLRRNTPSVAHYHPNSIQHTLMIEGKGKVKIDKQWKELRLFDPQDDESWCIIDKNVPHEFYPEEQEMVVISLHTCFSHELIEINYDGGEQRSYEPE